jgi:hypothetical protein
MTESVDDSLVGGFRVSGRFQTWWTILEFVNDSVRSGQFGRLIGNFTGNGRCRSWWAIREAVENFKVDE